MVKRSHEDHAVPAKKVKQQLNPIPSLSGAKLDVFVWGTGTICELGLGPNVTEVKRPRLSPLLPANEAGIVALASGGAHTIALDHEGHVWSWGQNDTGALGRDTKELEEERDEDEYDVNPKESTPQKIDMPKTDVQFVAVGATDSASCAITSEGAVYAWGTFIDDGNKAFSSRVKCQLTPIKITGLRKIVAVAGGKDHFLFLNSDGNVFGWGVSSAFQLGIKVRTSMRTRTTGPVRLPSLKNIIAIAAGDFNSYAIDVNNQVYSWGLNNFGQCGIEDPIGPGAVLEKPTLAEFWSDKQIVQIAGGGHHSLWLSADGSIYTVGETNFHQLGIPYTDLPDNVVREGNGTPSFVPTPTKLKVGQIEDDKVDLPPMKFVAVGTDHCLAISKTDGSIWTWGFGATYQLGHGKEPGSDGPEELEVPTMIKNTATLGRDMVWAGAGGQYSECASVAK